MNWTKESRDLEIRKTTSGTKEWADYNVNCIEGCYNNCRYCYARIMAKRFHRSSGQSWVNMTIRESVFCKRFKKRPGRIMFPSTHDLFEVSPFKEACLTILERLLESNNEVLVTTKPRMAVIREIVDRFGDYKEMMQFRFTITSNNSELLRFWEPNAPSFEERLSSLRFAFRNRFKTSISIEPFLDYDPAGLVEALMPFVTESIWIGKMNYISCKGISGKENIQYEKIRSNYETHHLLGIYRKLRNSPKIRFKDSVRIKLGLDTLNFSSN